MPVIVDLSDSRQSKQSRQSSADGTDSDSRFASIQLSDSIESVSSKSENEDATDSEAQLSVSASPLTHSHTESSVSLSYNQWIEQLPQQYRDIFTMSDDDEEDENEEDEENEDEEEEEKEQEESSENDENNEKEREQMRKVIITKPLTEEQRRLQEAVKIEQVNFGNETNEHSQNGQQNSDETSFDRELAAAQSSAHSHHSDITTVSATKQWRPKVTIKPRRVMVKIPLRKPAIVPVSEPEIERSPTPPLPSYPHYSSYFPVSTVYIPSQMYPSELRDYIEIETGVIEEQIFKEVLTTGHAGRTAGREGSETLNKQQAVTIAEMQWSQRFIDLTEIHTEYQHEPIMYIDPIQQADAQKAQKEEVANLLAEGVETLRAPKQWVTLRSRYQHFPKPSYRSHLRPFRPCFSSSAADRIFLSPVRFFVLAVHRMIDLMRPMTALNIENESVEQAWISSASSGMFEHPASSELSSVHAPQSAFDSISPNVVSQPSMLHAVDHSHSTRTSASTFDTAPPYSPSNQNQMLYGNDSVQEYGSVWVEEYEDETTQMDERRHTGIVTSADISFSPNRVDPNDEWGPFKSRSPTLLTRARLEAQLPQFSSLPIPRVPVPFALSTVLSPVNPAIPAHTRLTNFPSLILPPVRSPHYMMNSVNYRNPFLRKSHSAAVSVPASPVFPSSPIVTPPFVPSSPNFPHQPLPMPSFLPIALQPDGTPIRRMRFLSPPVTPLKQQTNEESEDFMRKEGKMTRVKTIPTRAPSLPKKPLPVPKMVSAPKRIIPAPPAVRTAIGSPRVHMRISSFIGEFPPSPSVHTPRDHDSANPSSALFSLPSPLTEPSSHSSSTTSTPRVSDSPFTTDPRPPALPEPPIPSFSSVFPNKPLPVPTALLRAKPPIVPIQRERDLKLKLHVKLKPVYSMNSDRAWRMAVMHGKDIPQSLLLHWKDKAARNDQRASQEEEKEDG